ncbi:MAG: menaquinone biosynthesis protein [Acidobacteriaceae bacterium]|nr:menaquinone biosynthesis protein [Acidobacteriaceae bacterium]
MTSDTSRPLLGAVSYLNTLPLVWGMVEGPQREEVSLSFSTPAVCADRVEQDTIQAGLVPVAEIARQHLQIVPGTGIVAAGPVRSILLFSKVPWRQIRILAADSGSRTSVELARVILRERFGAEPRILRNEPNLDEMLRNSDAALIIGDAALRIEPNRTGLAWLDLGKEWFRLTNLPMVFAVWAGKAGLDVARIEEITRASYLYGKSRLDEIIDCEHANRQIARDLAERYLRDHIHYELTARELEGLEAFFNLSRMATEVRA